MGFHLEEIELNALCDGLEDQGRAELIIRSSACRAATDRLARRHARSHQPKGVVPPPLPRAIALTLLRRGAELERDLQEQIDRDVMQGRMASAKQGTRHLHRCSRSRLGLALLAKVPATGELPQDSMPAGMAAAPAG